MKTAKKEHARIAAAKELLDRGYGKASQPLAGDPEDPLMPFPDKVEIVIVDPKGQLVPQGDQRRVSQRNSTLKPAAWSGRFPPKSGTASQFLDVGHARRGGVWVGSDCPTRVVPQASLPTLSRAERLDCIAGSILRWRLAMTRYRMM